MVSTRSSITPSEASTSRSANGGTADNSSSTPLGAGGTVDAAANGSSELAYSSTGLMSLSDELLARMWELAFVEPFEAWPFSAIPVNRRVYHVIIPVWYQRFYLGDAATFDKQAAALFRHPHQRQLVRHLAVRIDCTGPPLRSAVAAFGQLLRLKTLVLEADGDPTPHPFDEYLLDISCIPTLQELTVTVQTEAPITRTPPSFPALRELRIRNGHLANWILEGSNPTLSTLDLIVYKNQPVPRIPWRTVRYLHLDLPGSSITQARTLIGGLECADEDGEMVAAGLDEFSIRLSSSYALEDPAECRPIHQRLLSSLSKICIRHLRIDASPGGDWACAAGVIPAATITILWFSCSQWDTDAARWTQLARLLPLFPYLRRLELDDFDFCYLAATPAHQVASRLRPQHLAVQYPTLVAILLYLKHTQVLQLRLSCGYADTQLWATRSSTREDYSFERWTVEKAEQNLDEYW